MMRTAMTFSFAMLMGATCGSWAEEAGEKDAEAERNEKLMRIYDRAVSSYQFTLADSSTPLELRQQPVMQWVNVARVGTPRVQHGAVYVWTHQGRAEVLATVFSQTKPNQDPTFYHEMHSLSTGRIEARRDGQVYWNPDMPGIERKPFQRAPKPGSSARTRMVQMRLLAKRFSGYSINYDDARWDLRLLPEPVYRIPASTPKLVDSAVFALISTAGTDPEVLIVIEAPVNQESSRWEYAVCRFTDLKSWISLDDQEVWSFTNGSQGPSTDAGPTDRYRFSFEGSQHVP